MSMNRFFPALALLLSVVLALGACREDGQASQESAEPDAEHFNTRLSMQELMNLVLEPMADSLWETAGWIDDHEEGYYELYPETDEEWEQARRNAATIVEAGNLLALPGRVPEEGAWLTYANGISEVGVQAMTAAAEQDEDAWFQAGAQLYSVCRACHGAYDLDVSSRFVND